MSVFICKECGDKLQQDFECLTVGVLGKRKCEKCDKTVDCQKERYYVLRDDAYKRLTADTPRDPWYKGQVILFDCHGCAKCCKRKGMIYFSQEDIRNASQYLEMTVDDFEKMYILRTKDVAYIYVSGNARPCPFLNKANKCRIHDAKPQQCRSYPFWPNIMESKQKLNTERIHCKGIGNGRQVDVDGMTKFTIPEGVDPETEITLRGLVSCSYNYKPDKDGRCRSTACLFSSVRADKIKLEGCDIYKVVQEIEKGK